MVARVYDSKKTSEMLKKLRKEKRIKNEHGEELKVTQKMLHEITGIALSSIKQYESGARVPDYYNMNLLCKFYRVDESYITGESSYKNYLHRIDEENKEHIQTIKNHLLLDRFCEYIGCPLHQLESSNILFDEIVEFIRNRYEFYSNQEVK